MKKVLKKIFIVGAVAFLLLAVFAACVWFKIGSYEVYERPQDAPEMEYALVLGSIKYLKNGSENLYYKTRIETAAELYRLGKAKKIIASGDNSRADYDEPTQMKADLAALGVPESAIFADYAGLRTLDSIRRAKNLFACEKFIVVSQPLHCKRALFLCEANGMPNCAAAAAVPNVKFSYKLRNNSREMLAWIKAWLDVNILKKKAKFEN
ncbi:MAG: YdcF family protein [Opitutales bacterium]|nr:YdcF family protein [Opitutales bacterium]